MARRGRQPQDVRRALGSSSGRCEDALHRYRVSRGDHQLERFGFIITGSQLQAAQHRMEMRSASFAMRVVGVSHPRDALEVAREMVNDGVQLIELCGGFGPVWTARLLEAIDHRVPVGAVSYGPEAIAGLSAVLGEKAEVPRRS